MKHVPDEQQMEKLLENLLPDASLRLDARLSTAPWTPRVVARRRLINISVVAVLLFALFVTVLPQGRAFAQRIFLFFRTTEEKSFPIPTEQVYSLPPAETPVPTYILPLESVEPVASTQTPQVSDRSCTSPQAQSGYFCQIKAVEAQAGFDAKELPHDPNGMKFSKVTFDPTSKTIAMEFVVITGGGYLYLRQGMGEFPLADQWGEVPADAIEQVTVNGQYAELVLGTFIVYPNTTEAVWEPGGQLLLHWREDDRWFSLEKLGDPYPIEWIGKKEIVELAESLVDERPLNEVPPVDPEYLTSVEAAEQLAGFDVPVPTLLPEAYELKRVAWVYETRVLLFYGPKKSTHHPLMISVGRGAKAGTCLECPPGTVEEVQIGPWLGWYWRGIFNMGLGIHVDPTPTPVWEPDARHWVLSWNTYSLWFSISYFSSSAYDGEMNKETMIKIAESMK